MFTKVYLWRYINVFNNLATPSLQFQYDYAIITVNVGIQILETLAPQNMEQVIIHREYNYIETYES